MTAKTQKPGEIALLMMSSLKDVEIQLLPEEKQLSNQPKEYLVKCQVQHIQETALSKEMK